MTRSRAHTGLAVDASTVPFGRWDMAFAILAFGSGALLLYLRHTISS